MEEAALNRTESISNSVHTGIQLQSCIYGIIGKAQIAVQMVVKSYKFKITRKNGIWRSLPNSIKSPALPQTDNYQYDLVNKLACTLDKLSIVLTITAMIIAPTSDIQRFNCRHHFALS